MKKFHIGANGEVTRCKARLRPCPLGGPEIHGKFNDIQEAQRWAETKIAAEVHNPLSKKRTKKEVLTVVKLNGVFDDYASGEIEKLASKLGLEKDDVIFVPDGRNTYAVHSNGRLWLRHDISGKTNASSDSWKDHFYEVSPEELVELTATKEGDAWAQSVLGKPASVFGNYDERQANGEALQIIRENSGGKLTLTDVKRAFPQAKSFYSHDNVIAVSDGKEVMEIEFNSQNVEIWPYNLKSQTVFRNRGGSEGTRLEGMTADDESEGLSDYAKWLKKLAPEMPSFEW